MANLGWRGERVGVQGGVQKWQHRWVGGDPNEREGAGWVSKEFWGGWDLVSMVSHERIGWRGQSLRSVRCQRRVGLRLREEFGFQR